MRRGTAAVVAAWMIGFGGGNVAAQTTPVVRPFGTLQVQFNTTSVGAADAAGVVPAASTFETRRMRMGAEIRFGDVWTGRIEPELSMGRLQLRNAWIEMMIADGWSIRAGQFKKPFGLIQLTSSTRLPAIERGVRIRGLAQAAAQEDAAAGQPLLTRMRGTLLLGESQTLLNALGYQGYDLGAAVYGSVGALTVQAGVFNGNGPDQLDDTGAKSMAARASMALAPRVTLGAAASYRETLLDAATDTRVNGWAWSADLEAGDLQRAGPTVLLELTAGENLAADERFVSAHAMAAWYAPASFGRFEAVEAVARVGYADPRRDSDGDEAVLLTPGLNLYITGRNRLMLNWDVFLPRGDAFSTQHALRAQAQLLY